MDMLLQFIIAVFVLLVIPGTDMAYCIATGISHGAKGAFFAATGIGFGGLILTLITAIVIFLSGSYDPEIFNFLQILGSLYLLYLGITILISKNDLGKDEFKKFAKRSIFFRGVITNISNPKALVFFISFIPQFIPSDAQKPYFLALIFGVVLCAIGTTVNFIFGLIGVSFKKTTSQKIWGRSISDYITSLVFISVAIIFLGNFLGNYWNI